MLKRRTTSTVAAIGAMSVAVATAVAGGGFQGSDGVGDPYYPKMGNTGYDAQSYDYKLDYRRSGKVKAKTVIQAQAQTNGPPLSRFNLDFRGPKPERVEVDDVDADFSRAGQELVITPDALLANGVPFEVVVVYRGRPKQVSNPDGTKDGWTETKDGVVALGEPQAVPSFVPVNDHPTDKATWHTTITVPKPLYGISNGELVDTRKSKKTVTTEWDQDEPMSSYLQMVTIGKYRIDKATVAGIPYLSAVDRKYSKGNLEALRENTKEALEFMETVAGPYPFSAIGGIADPSRLGFALENQSRSYYPGPPNRQLVIHETAHQWYGDSVAVDRWKEIWLNEGFATYMEWLNAEETGGESVADRLDRIHSTQPAGDSVWDPPPADPGGPQDLFAGSVYDRGAMALQVLREEIGDTDFRAVLLAWAQNNEGGNANTEDFYDLIEQITGETVPQSFQDWLYEEGKPDLPSAP